MKANYYTKQELEAEKRKARNRGIKQTAKYIFSIAAISLLDKSGLDSETVGRIIEEMDSFFNATVEDGVTQEDLDKILLEEYDYIIR